MRRILRKHKLRRDEGHDCLTPKKTLPRESKLDAFLPKIRETFEEFPDVTGQRLFEISRSRATTGASASCATG